MWKMLKSVYNSDYAIWMKEDSAEGEGVAPVHYSVGWIIQNDEMAKSYSPLYAKKDELVIPVDSPDDEYRVAETLYNSIAGIFASWNKLELVEEFPENQAEEWIPVQDSYGDLFTKEEFKRDCKEGCLIDYDGHGYLVKDNVYTRQWLVYPSLSDALPKWATHVLWFNR